MALSDRVQVRIDELRAAIVALDAKHGADKARLQGKIQALRAVKDQITPEIEQVLLDAGIELKAAP